MTSADLAACRALLRGGSRSFFAASLLLPGRVCRPATALYAFCRVADDLIDEADDPGPALAILHQRLDAMYAGRPCDAAPDRALASVVARYRVPRILLDHLLDGFAWDAAGRRYADVAALHDYAARVAGAVGAIMALLMGVRDPGAVARACDLGIAMQLTNIARDVGEDARAGRLYLPLDWLAEAGIDADAFLAAPAFTPALGGVVRRVLAEADALYARADSGIAVLPLDCRPGIATARRLYAAIGDRVLANGCDPVTARARVGAAGKLALAGRSLLAAPFPGRALPAAPLPCALRLISAIPPAPRSAKRGMTGQVVWLLELFGQLDQRQARG